MKSFAYESQGTESVLVYHLEPEEHLDSFAKGMLQGNEMEGILRPVFMQRDRERYLKYPVTSKIPLKDFVSGEMERETVLRLCLSVVNAVKEMEEYMMGQEKLLLDWDYIFVDVRRKNAGLVYLPVDEFSQEVTAAEFLRNLLSHLRFRMDQDVSYVAKLLHFLNQPKGWEYEELKHYLENLLAEKKEAAAAGSVKADAEQTAQSGYAARQEAFGMGETAGRRYGETAGRATAEEREEFVLHPVLDSVSAEDAEPVNMASEQEEGKKKKAGWFGTRKKSESAEASPKKKTGLFGRGKKKEAKPLIVANSSAASLIPSVQIPEQPPMQAPARTQAQTPEQPPMQVPARTQAQTLEQPPMQARVQAQAPVRMPMQTPVSGQPQPLPKKDARPDAVIWPQRQASPIPQTPEEGTVYMSSGSSDEEDRTVILGGGTEERSTVLLGNTSAERAAGHRTATIIRKRTGQRMTIHQDAVRIGSEGSFVDFYIMDNQAIGGCHADITRADGAWYITDRNSANHTYVNGIMVPPMQSVRLENRAVITLADEDFDFIIG